jgi:hypothetical protein
LLELNKVVADGIEVARHASELFEVETGAPVAAAEAGGAAAELVPEPPPEDAPPVVEVPGVVDVAVVDDAVGASGAVGAAAVADAAAVVLLDAALSDELLEPQAVSVKTVAKIAACVIALNAFEWSPITTCSCE